MAEEDDEKTIFEKAAFAKFTGTETSGQKLEGQKRADANPYISDEQADMRLAKKALDNLGPSKKVQDERLTRQAKEVEEERKRLYKDSDEVAEYKAAEKMLDRLKPIPSKEPVPTQEQLRQDDINKYVRRGMSRDAAEMRVVSEKISQNMPMEKAPPGRYNEPESLGDKQKESYWSRVLGKFGTRKKEVSAEEPKKKAVTLEELGKMDVEKEQNEAA